ncbi:unnamed protein product [Clavelina lepadiformis]|uniref:Uncharacterized protein n=1 Tax=Clavelina lepadiformis TaxID=159417 RepID=A0ABP0GUL6_CLALP
MEIADGLPKIKYKNTPGVTKVSFSFQQLYGLFENNGTIFLGETTTNTNIQQPTAKTATGHRQSNLTELVSSLHKFSEEIEQVCFYVQFILFQKDVGKQ